MWRISSPGAMMLLLLALPAFATRTNYTCATCHKQARTQPLTSMGHAMRFAPKNPLFLKQPELTLRKGKFLYSIDTRDGKTTYTVSNGTSSISTPVRWVFGEESQTYVLRRDGKFYESLVSYYPGIHGLDTTMGDERIHPQSLEQAFGRPLHSIEYTACFGCHSTGSIVGHRLDLTTLQPGVRCEHCHVGANKHLAGFLSGKPSYKPPDLKRLSPEDISTFCGQCHRSWATVVRKRLRGPVDVRFQPYRLELSKCFDGSDQRISCLACHDPHKEVDTNDKDYDRKCLACHSPGAKLSLGMIKAHPHATAMPVCPVSKTNCVSCHMPKVPLPGGHQIYTDHFIRIVQKDAPYPD
ncbi:MAG: multiheme c-type cytochrome [Bryobacteraceae bacterium]